MGSMTPWSEESKGPRAVFWPFQSSLREVYELPRRQTGGVQVYMPEPVWNDEFLTKCPRRLASAAVVVASLHRCIIIEGFLMAAQ
jgi:hypothetical protein